VRWQTERSVPKTEEHAGIGSLTGRWRRQKKRGLSIRVLISLVVVTVFVVSAAVMAVFVAWKSTRSRVAEAIERTKSTAAELAQLYAAADLRARELARSNAASGKDFRVEALDSVNQVLETWFKPAYYDKDLAWAYVRGENGEVVIGKLRAHLVHPPPDLKTDAEIRDWFLARIDRIEGDFFKRTVGLERDTDGKRTRYAEVKIGYSLARIHRLLWDQLFDWGLAVPIVGGAGVLIVLLLFFFRWIILNPLKTLAGAMEDVRRGWYDTQVKLARNDEIGTLAETFNYMVKGLEERERLEDAFKRYVSPQVLDKIQSSGTQIHFRGETRRVAVLFSDIRGFTTMSEKLLPEQVVAQLTEYFTDMVDVVMRHDGYINKFVGDAIMAVWGAPLDQDQLEMRAVRAGVEMIDALTALNNRRAARKEPPIEIGVGISTGFAVAGNIGHTDRLEYTVIGDAVNVAQRIEAETKKVHRTLLISESTYRPVANSIVADELPTMLVKGKEEPLKLYAVRGFSGDERTVREPFAPEPSQPATPAAVRPPATAQPVMPAAERTAEISRPDRVAAGAARPLRSGAERAAPAPGRPARDVPEVTAPMPSLSAEDTLLNQATRAPTAPIVELTPEVAAKPRLQPAAPFAPPPPTVPAYHPASSDIIPLVKGKPEVSGQSGPPPTTGVMNKPSPTSPPAAAPPAETPTAPVLPAADNKAEIARKQGVDVPVETTGELDFWTKPTTKFGPDGG
jgi:class 3 adenylate cyclase